MTEYKIVSRKMFSKEATFEDTINSEARNGWKVISIGYGAGGEVAKAVFERSNDNH
ncbi:MAG: DUF4177 domain-containing protein [Urechidicola sp.]|jgi:hypothetical protein